MFWLWLAVAAVVIIIIAGLLSGGITIETEITIETDEDGAKRP